MKVWIVEYQDSHYDSQILGVFSGPELADKAIESFLDSDAKYEVSEFEIDTIKVVI